MVYIIVLSIEAMEGVIGVFTKRSAATKCLYLLYGVQHRGQESSGITAAGDHSLRTWKGEGLVSRVFTEKYSAFVHPDDYVIIGNASGENTDNEYAPVVDRRHERYEFSLALDGFFKKNSREINEEVFKDSLNSYLEKGDNLLEAFKKTMEEHQQSYYSLVMAAWDKQTNSSMLIAARDARGVRPLYMAKSQKGVFFASESAPIDVLESMGEVLTDRQDVIPGTMIVVTKEGIKEIKVLEPRPATCVFEWVYFGRPDSVIEGKTVHKVRKRLGHGLVRTHELRKLYNVENGPRDDLVVIPVPDSGRSVCTGVAEELGVPADEGVIKNAYLGRTYIIDDPIFRKTASDIKHNIIRETVKDKKIVISDDSIVRGTVSESVAKNLLKAGAREVDFLVSYAPIFYPCFSDPPDKPLAAQPFKGKSLQEIGALVAENLPSINNVRFNSEETIKNAVGLDGKICTYCISGLNPFREK
jgi:amidophosphoribosyltransferase